MSAKVVVYIPTETYDAITQATGNAYGSISKFMREAAKEKLERDTAPSIIPERENA